MFLLSLFCLQEVVVCACVCVFTGYQSGALPLQLLKSAAAVLLALAAALAPSLADDAGESQQSAKEEQASGERLVDESDSKVLQKNKFIFGSLSTTTYTGVAVSTSTVFFSCLLGTAATVCQGRRRRLRKNVKFNASPPAVYESEYVGAAAGDMWLFFIYRNRR